MRRSVAWRGLAAIVFAATLVSGCASAPTEEGPAGAVRQFYDRLNRGDHAGAKALYSAEALGFLDDPGGSSDGFGDWANGETKRRSVAEVRVVSTEEREGAADVQFDVHYRDGSSVSRRVSLVQESGAWKLGFIS